MRSNGGGRAWWCIAGPSWSWWSMAGPGGSGCGRRKCCGGGMRPLLPIPETKDDARVVKLGQKRGEE